MKMTRRKLAVALASATAAAAQQPQPAASTDNDLIKAARDRMQANATALSGIPLPMATEPAFQFKA
jgi:hypothetical protein